MNEKKKKLVKLVKDSIKNHGPIIIVARNEGEMVMAMTGKHNELVGILKRGMEHDPQFKSLVKRALMDSYLPMDKIMEGILRSGLGADDESCRDDEHDCENCDAKDECPLRDLMEVVTKVRQKRKE